jgi:hypothetical protein
MRISELEGLKNTMKILEALAPEFKYYHTGIGNLKLHTIRAAGQTLSLGF